MNASNALKFVTLSLTVFAAGCNAPVPVDDTPEGSGTDGSSTDVAITTEAQPCLECSAIDSDCEKNAACVAARSHYMSCSGSPNCEAETQSAICKEYGNSMAVIGLSVRSDLINCVAYSCLGKVDNCAQERQNCEAVPGCLQIGECMNACKCAGVDEMGNGAVDQDLVGECMGTCQGEPSAALTAWTDFFNCR